MSRDLAPHRGAGPKAFRCEVTEARSEAIVSLHGELDLATTPDTAALLTKLAETKRQLTLDLRGLDFIDSTGIKLVHEIEQRARQNGLEFAVVQGNHHIQHVFELTGLDSRITFLDADTHPAP